MLIRIWVKFHGNTLNTIIVKCYPYLTIPASVIPSPLTNPVNPGSAELFRIILTPTIDVARAARMTRSFNSKIGQNIFLRKNKRTGQNFDIL